MKNNINIGMSRYTQIYINTGTGRWLTQTDNHLTGITTVSAVQNTPSTVWIVPHNMSSNKFLIQIKNSSNEEVIPDEVEITDPDTITITFGTQTSGEANLLFF